MRGRWRTALAVAAVALLAVVVLGMLAAGAGDAPTPGRTPTRTSSGWGR